MGETILKIGTGELGVVRVTCEKCKVVTEVEVDGLTQRFRKEMCLHCGSPFFPSNIENNAFVELESAFLAFKNASNKLKIEFVYKINAK